jgi:hypothetical protein
MTTSSGCSTTERPRRGQRLARLADRRGLCGLARSAVITADHDPLVDEGLSYAIDCWPTVSRGVRPFRRDVPRLHRLCEASSTWVGARDLICDRIKAAVRDSRRYGARNAKSN